MIYIDNFVTQQSSPLLGNLRRYSPKNSGTFSSDRHATGSDFEYHRFRRQIGKVDSHVWLNSIIIYQYLLYLVVIMIIVITLYDINNNYIYTLILFLLLRIIAITLISNNDSNSIPLMCFIINQLRYLGQGRPPREVPDGSIRD